MHRKRRFGAALAFVALIMLGIVPPSPAVAYNGQDVAGTTLANWTVTGAGPLGPTSCANCFDENETTFEVGSYNGTPSVHPMAVTWTKSGSGGSFTVESFRFNVGACSSGWPYTGGNCGTGGTPADITRIVIMCTPANQNGSYDAGLVVYDETVSGFHGGHDTDQVDLDTPCTITQATGTPDAGETRRMWIRLTLSGAPDIMWKSLQFFDEGTGPTTVPITDYIYNLRASHPPFMRVYDWQWRDVSWEGTWVVTNDDDEALETSLNGTMPFNEVIGSHDGFEIRCPLICGADTYTITINDTLNNRVATYEIDGEDDGTLIANIREPVIRTYHACYNASTDQCVGLSGVLWTAQAAGTLQTNYTWEGDPADATICHKSLTAGLPACAGTPSTIAGQTEGNYRRTFTSVDTSLSPAIIFKIVNTQLAANAFPRYLVATVNYGTGGAVEVVPPDDVDPDPGVRSCNSTDLALIACRLGQLIDILGGQAEEFIEDAWTPAVRAVREAALTKLPFAYVVMATDGIGTQLATIGAEVENSDDCEGLTLQVPLYYGSSPSTPTPTTLPITVLTCAQLEPFMGTTWYQAIRTAMDPALWLLFAWSQFKALQPRPSLNG